MSKRKAESYLGGNTIISVGRQNFEAGLAQQAEEHRRLFAEQQRLFDQEMEKEIYKRDVRSRVSENILKGRYLLRKRQGLLKKFNECRTKENALAFLKIAIDGKTSTNRVQRWLKEQS